MRVVVVGLAETGLAVTRRLRAEHADVTVVEDLPAHTAAYAERRRTVDALGAVVLEAPAPDEVARVVGAADLVVPSPLVREAHPAIVAARAAGVPVRSEIDLAAERARVQLVAVTGTNGKTTVTSMIAAMLERSGVRALAAGNIGRPLVDAVDAPVDVVVAEVSSFQLAFAETFRPSVAVLLAITPDHLDWHGTFERYAAAKARIVEHQRDADVLVFDADDPRASAVARAAPARTLALSARGPSGDYRVDGDRLVLPDGNTLVRIAELRRALPHDLTNGLAASAASLAAGATLEGVRATLREYETMRHRVTLVGEAGDVRWFDDSKATNPDAALRAVCAFDSVVLLAGGRNKGLDLSVLRAAAPHLRAVVAFGEAAPDIVDAFSPTEVPVTVAASMHEAVRTANEAARRGDVVLLSPACASFDAYDGYAQRGDDFAAEVDALLSARGANA